MALYANSTPAPCAPPASFFDLSNAYNYACAAAAVVKSDAAIDALLDLADHIWARMKRARITSRGDALRKLDMVHQAWREDQTYIYDGPLLFEQLEHWMRSGGGTK